VTNHHSKFKDSRLYHLAAIDRKLFVTVTLTFDLVTSKTLGVFYVSWPTTTPSLKILGHTVLQLLIGNYRSTNRPINQHVQSNISPLFQKGGINIAIYRNTIFPGNTHPYSRDRVRPGPSGVPWRCNPVQIKWPAAFSSVQRNPAAQGAKLYKIQPIVGVVVVYIPPMSGEPWRIRAKSGKQEIKS